MKKLHNNGEIRDKAYYYQITSKRGQINLIFSIEDNLNYYLIVDKAPKNNQVWTQRMNLEPLTYEEAWRHLKSRIEEFLEVLKAGDDLVALSQKREDPIVIFLCEAFEGFARFD